MKKGNNMKTNANIKHDLSDIDVENMTYQDFLDVLMYHGREEFIEIFDAWYMRDEGRFGNYDVYKLVISLVKSYA